MKKMLVVEWLCGLWAVGLGSRMVLELWMCDGWIHVPRHPLNIFFDFGMLAVFGLVVAVVTTHELVKGVRNKLSESV